uniref:Uncharacterized protein n=1 Tax=Solanum lycopersicum TaxID=4081 RepID=A0A3Q7IUH0_SOLLC
MGLSIGQVFDRRITPSSTLSGRLVNFTCHVTSDTYISTFSYFFPFQGCKQHANLSFEKLEMIGFDFGGGGVWGG